MRTKSLFFAMLGLLSASWCISPLQAAESKTIAGFTLIKIEAGCFEMGRDVNFKESSRNELPTHKVCISKPFYLGETEVTQNQWQKIMGNNPSKYQLLNNPVERVSWNDVQDFIAKLNEQEGGKNFRLPTEAEWEYAARAGSRSVYFYGDDSKKLSKYAWFGNEGYRGKAHPVAETQANPWGLYDMHGNVFEWVQDWYSDSAYGSSAAEDPTGPESGKFKVYRGGSWVASAFNARSAARFSGLPATRSADLGLRLLWEP